MNAKKFFAFFMIFSVGLYSIEEASEDNPSSQGYAYPLLSLTKRYPIEISMQNRLELLNNPEIQKEENIRNLNIINRKKVPGKLLLSILLLSLFFLIIRTFPSQKKIFKPLKDLTAKKKALETLKKIEEREFQKKQFENYYIDLADTLRLYFEEAHHVKASTQTTPEFLLAIKKSSFLDVNTKNLLEDFLRHSDLVKFAEQEPSLEECLLAKETATKIIHLT